MWHTRKKSVNQTHPLAWGTSRSHFFSFCAFRNPAYTSKFLCKNQIKETFKWWWQSTPRRDWWPWSQWRCLQSLSQIFLPNMGLSQTLLSHSIWMAGSDAVYKFQQAFRHKHSDQVEVLLTVISNVAGIVSVRSVCLIGAGGISRVCYCLCYLWADGPVEPYHRCWGDWSAAEAQQERSLDFPTLLNCLQVPSSA